MDITAGKTPEQQMAEMAAMMLKLQAQVEKQSSSGDEDNPLGSFVYVEEGDLMCHKDTKVKTKRTSFNVSNNKHVPEAVKKSASGYACDNLLIPTANGIMYWPGKDEVFDHGNATWFNSFNINDFAVMQDHTSEQGKSLVGRVVKHFTFLYGEEYATILIKWLAHNVQFPGVKIFWAICLVSIVHGVGKSLPEAIEKAAMGSTNIREISSDAINSDFTSWTMGGCVAICDEIRIRGNNSKDKINTLKNAIAKSTITYIQKGRDEQTCQNTQNYLFTTNNLDALPLEANDRRWCVLQDSLKDISESTEFYGEPHEDYMERLFDDINNSGGILRSWLMTIDLSDFNPTGRAPDSQAKQEMLENSRSNLYHNIKDIIDTHFKPDVIVGSYVRTMLNDQFKMSPNSKYFGQTMEELGYDNIGRVLIGTSKESIYVLKSAGLSEDEAKSMAKKSMSL